MRRPAGLAGMLALAIAVARCTSFTSSDASARDRDADVPDGPAAVAGDAGVPDGGSGALERDGAPGSGWPPPNPSCPTGLWCCLAFDGGGTCTGPGECPPGRTSLQCQRHADCPAALPFCCSVVQAAEADS